MSDRNQKGMGQGASEEMADEALKRNFRSIADAVYDPEQQNDGSQAMQGLDETHQQVATDD